MTTATSTSTSTSSGGDAVRTPGPPPGAADRPRSPADDCVHCGFCLPACPTYASWHEEADSPRGRIDLYRAVVDGELPLDEQVASHFDRCLGCMGCLTACPSGVRYDLVLEDARARVEHARRRPLAERLHRALVFALFPHPRRLRLVALLLLLWRWSGLQALLRRSGLLRRLAPRLAALEAVAPPVTLRGLLARLPGRVEAAGTSRLRVGLVTGCVQHVFFPGVNAATLRVLAAEGCEVVVPPGQGCCGALSLHAGREEEALAMTRALVARFEAEAVDLVAVNAAGCGSHLKEAGRLLAHDPAWAARAAAFSARVRDVTELVAALAPRATRHPLPVRVAYHSACHLGHAQRLQDAPRAILRAIPGLELVEVAEPDACCGSAGIYNLVQPESAAEIGRRKAASLIAARPELIASANPGCTLHLASLLRERGAAIPAAHPVELLDRSIAGAGVKEPPRR